ncbi:MAG TPA: 3-hydroxyacyl-CoA dehydrogenase family protein [Ignavibacteria bacterium]|nr:3-hydroxyacyl-CoA dehydrogenase family protein [Ignavibacteria bacterium]
MEKVFLIGDNEDLMKELSELLKSKYEIADELNESVEFVFELTNFNKEIKFNILNFINEKNSKAVVISSSLCITALEQAVNSQYPERMLGAGLYRTFSKVKGIELCKTRFTTEENFSKAKSLFENLGKEVFTVTDRIGMISMRIISMIINEAYLVLQEGTSNKEDIDTAMKLGTNYPYGPIDWSERIGAELIYNILRSMHEEYGDDRYRITPLLKEKYLESLKG